MKSECKCKGKRCIMKLYSEDKYIYMDEHSTKSNNSSINIWYSGNMNEDNL